VHRTNGGITLTIAINMNTTGTIVHGKT